MIDVHVPANARMLVGRIGPQPEFGLMSRSGYQYQLLEQIPLSSFKNPERILTLRSEKYLSFTP